jgi:hypothetical protein
VNDPFSDSICALLGARVPWVNALELVGSAHVAVNYQFVRSTLIITGLIAMSAAQERVMVGIATGVVPVSR